MLKKLLLMCSLLMLISCAKTEVSIMDNTAVGHRNIHVVFTDDDFDDPLGVGEYLVEGFLEHGVSASKHDNDNANKQKGSGSGFVVANGYWITNHHVVDELNSLKVSVTGAEYPVELVASDKTLDLALLRGSTGGLKPFQISEAKVGQEVFAIGYPLPDILGSKARITSGLVSSMQGLQGDSDNIQISAPIQPGNSGGPVVSKDWKVVGVAVSTASTVNLASRTGTIPQGLNFAVSPNHLKGFLMQNGVNPEGPYVSSMDEAIASSALVWSGKVTNQKRTYYAQYKYVYYWDLGDHIQKLQIKLIDAFTGKVVLTSKTESRGLGVKIPAKQAAEDVLTRLGLVVGKVE